MWRGRRKSKEPKELSNRWFYPEMSRWGLFKMKLREIWQGMIFPPLDGGSWPLFIFGTVIFWIIAFAICSLVVGAGFLFVRAVFQALGLI